MAKTNETPREAFNRVTLEMFTKAVAKGDPSSLSLIDTVINAVRMSLSRKDIDLDLAAARLEQIEPQLDRMFRVIIEHDDFDLFKSAINELALTIVSSDTFLSSEIASSNWRALQAYHFDPSKSIDRKTSEQVTFIRQYSGRDFRSTLQIPSLLAGLKPDGAPDDVLDEVRANSLAIYANYLLLRVFFMVSVNLLFNYNRTEISSDTLTTYLSELWHHTAPQDADAISANATPVPSNPVWLTLLYLYGGVNSRIWTDRYSFQDFHGISKYVTQNYLLGLVKIDNPIFAPTDRQISELAESQLWDQLGELYEYSAAFLQETNDQKFKLELQKLPELHLDQFIARNRRAKEGVSWHQELLTMIENAQKSFTHARELIEGFLPLDEIRRIECLTAISNAYFAESLVEHAAIPTPCTSSKDLESLKPFSMEYVSIPKHCFLKDAAVDCSSIWEHIASEVVLRENMHIYEIASRQQKTVVQDNDSGHIFEEVRSLVREMVAKKNAPDLALVPLNLMMDWVRTFKVKYEPHPTLSFPGAKLKLVHSWDRWKFRDIVIIDRNRCQWLYEEFNGKRLDPSIMPGKTGSTVQINVRARGRFVPDPKGTHCLQLPLEVPSR
jgi:hypothetical protein